MRRDLTIAGAVPPHHIKQQTQQQTQQQAQQQTQQTQLIQQAAASDTSAAEAPTDEASAADPAAWAVLDLSFLRDKVALAPNITITFQHIIIKRSYLEWIPGVHFLQYAPNTTVRLHKAVRELPACPQDLDWLRQVVQNHNIPPGYTPPAHLYPGLSNASKPRSSTSSSETTTAAQADVPVFLNLLETIDQQQCEQRWQFPASCSSQGLLVTRLAYDVPRQPDRRFAYMYVGFDEAFESYYPCLSFVADDCIQQQGYPACFTQAAVRAAQLASLQERKGNVTIGKPAPRISTALHMACCCIQIGAVMLGNSSRGESLQLQPWMLLSTRVSVAAAELHHACAADSMSLF